MLTSKKKITGLLILLLVLAIYMPAAVSAAESSSLTTKDMVWSASDGTRREIYFSSYTDGAWSSPIQVTYDDTENITPCIDMDTEGNKYLVWTAVSSEGQTVKYAVYENGSWSEPQSLPSMPAVATSPFVSVDGDGVVWIVFAGNDGEDDDIYYTRMEDGAWSTLQTVNADNETPDIDPYLELTASKRLQVIWKGYRDGGYGMLQSTWTGKTWADEQAVEEETDDESTTTSEEEEIPDFVEDTNMVFTRSYDN